MKRCFVIIIALCVMSLAKLQVAEAVLFSNEVNFSGSGTYLGADYQQITGSLWTITSPFEYTHTLDLTPPGESLNSATLSLTHVGNSRSWFIVPLEVWIAASGDNQYIGALSRSPLRYSRKTQQWQGAWVTDTWTLSPAVLAEMTSTTPWSLTMKAGNIGFVPNGKLWLDKSALCGDYTPTPEPATMSLLGLGLLGLFGVRKKKI